MSRKKTKLFPNIVFTFLSFFFFFFGYLCLNISKISYSPSCLPACMCTWSGVVKRPQFIHTGNLRDISSKDEQIKATRPVRGHFIKPSYPPSGHKQNESQHFFRSKKTLTAYLLKKKKDRRISADKILNSASHLFLKFHILQGSHFFTFKFVHGVNK